jgi:hypothetical protein
VVSTVVRGKTEIKKEKLTCTSCGSDKNPEDFYASNSPFHKHTGKLHLCKVCLWNFIDDDIERLKIALRMVDKPFLVSLLQSSIEEAEKTNKNLIKIYMKNVGMNQYKTSTWDDSEFNGHKSIKKQTRESEEVLLEIDNDEELTQQELKNLIHFFGKGFETEDYIWLQNEYEDFLNRYECDSKGMELLIKEICLQQLDIQKRRAVGEKVDAQLKTLQDLLGSSNLKPVQETGANAVEQESFGTLIKKFEREKPIPEADPLWKDVDGIGKYIKTFFFGHMARALGIENKYQDEYQNEINKYTVEHSDEEDGEFDG